MTGTVAALAYNSPLNFFLGRDPPADLPPEVQAAVTELYNAVQQVIQALVNNCGIGPQSLSVWPQLVGSPSTLLAGNLRRFYVTASEDILDGSVVNLFTNAGVINARNANSTNATRPADGFCTTGGGIAAGSIGEVQLGAGLATVSGLTPGQRYWLAPTNGQVQAAPDTTAGHIEQVIGVAIDAANLWVNLSPFWLQH